MRAILRVAKCCHGASAATFARGNADIDYDEGARFLYNFCAEHYGGYLRAARLIPSHFHPSPHHTKEATPPLRICRGGSLVYRELRGANH